MHFHLQHKYALPCILRHCDQELYCYVCPPCFSHFRSHLSGSCRRKIERARSDLTWEPLRHLRDIYRYHTASSIWLTARFLPTQQHSTTAHLGQWQTTALFASFATSASPSTAYTT